MKANMEEIMKSPGRRKEEDGQREHGQRKKEYHIDGARFMWAGTKWSSSSTIYETSPII